MQRKCLFSTRPARNSEQNPVFSIIITARSSLHIEMHAHFIFISTVVQGKSTTIAGLVTALLSGKAPLPGQRQPGCLIQSIQGPGGKPGAETHARNRILVCATTNQAVDHLAWKIAQVSSKWLPV